MILQVARVREFEVFGIGIWRKWPGGGGLSVRSLVRRVEAATGVKNLLRLDINSKRRDYTKICRHTLMQSG